MLWMRPLFIECVSAIADRCPRRRLIYVSCGQFQLPPFNAFFEVEQRPAAAAEDGVVHHQL